jgi:AcrR family transcriptional regulator
MTKQLERREVILDAALSIADRDGIEALTLRRIEQETGLSAPLVYRHFKDKAAIIHGLLERLQPAGEDTHAQPEASRAWLESVFVQLYRNGRDHSVLLTLLSSADSLQENALRMTERVLGALRERGLDAARAGHAFQLLIAYTMGSAAMAHGTKLTHDVLARALPRLPALLASGPYLDPRDEAVFLRGLTTLLDALQLNA